MGKPVSSRGSTTPATADKAFLSCSLTLIVVDFVFAFLRLKCLTATLSMLPLIVEVVKHKCY